MKQIWLVTSREYLTRVKKKSFIIMTLLGPLLIAAFYGSIMFVFINEAKKETDRFIEVIDESGLVKGQLKNSDHIFFSYTDKNVAEARKNLDSGSHYAILYFPSSFTLERPIGVQLFTREQASLATQGRIEKSIEKELTAQRMELAGLSKEKIDSLDADIKMNVLLNTGETGERAKTGVLTILAYGLSFIMYMFIFIYGVQVMRGVMEEKTNRIVEVVISTVRPFQLMMGKIFGIALVGLTQFLIWAVLSTTLIIGIGAIIGPSMDVQSMQEMQQMSSMNVDTSGQEEAAELLEDLKNVNFFKFFSAFLFYFIFGYLLYSAMFAAIGSAVDNETDTQQFMLPITLPIIFSMVVSFSSVVNDPHSSLAWWFSIIPLTSPVAMMARLPFIEGHGWDLALSMLLLVLGFIGATWLAGRIYRTGILMYGKKVTYKELLKWLTYKG